MVTAVGVAGVVGMLMARSAPGWWKPANAADVRARATADAFEARVVDELHRPRVGSGEWAVSIPQDALNAWLVVRGPAWARKLGSDAAWLEQLSVVQGRFTPGSAGIGAGVGVGSARRVISAEIEPTVSADGLRVTLRSAAVGRLPVPVGLALDVVRRGGGEAADVLAGRSVAMPVSFELADGRRVTIVGLRPVDRAVEVRLRTDAPP